jgi:dihydroorotate dehydrogenase
LLAGADLLQLYTALALHGPYIVVDILRQLRALVIADGASAVSEIKGVLASPEKALSHAAHIAKIAAETSEKN